MPVVAIAPPHVQVGAVVHEVRSLPEMQEEKEEVKEAQKPPHQLTPFYKYLLMRSSSLRNRIYQHHRHEMIIDSDLSHC